MQEYLNVIKNHYADFEGRARRREYWMFFLFNFLIAMVLSFLATKTESMLVNIVSTLYSLAVLLPGIAVGIRRLHDTGKSGWYLLIGLIPFVGAIILIVFFIMDSQPGDNQYGPNPKGVQA
ncbi:MAG: DUF805 domain-containing protein [Bacteroidales bacterium]|nr:DUF805 domain-containing protein [Bacteroidales bacterium]